MFNAIFLYFFIHTLSNESKAGVEKRLNSMIRNLSICFKPPSVRSKRRIDFGNFSTISGNF